MIRIQTRHTQVLFARQHILLVGPTGTLWLDRSLSNSSFFYLTLLEFFIVPGVYLYGNIGNIGNIRLKTAVIKGFAIVPIVCPLWEQFIWVVPIVPAPVLGGYIVSSVFKGLSGSLFPLCIEARYFT